MARMMNGMIAYIYVRVKDLFVGVVLRYLPIPGHVREFPECGLD